MLSNKNNGQSSFWIIAFCLAYVLSLVWNIGLQQLMAEEPRRAIISIEMLQHDNYAHSTLLGHEYFNKPPFFNWIIIGLIKLFNSTDEWVMRIPSIVSIILLGLFQYRFVKKGFEIPQMATLSALMLITFADIYLYGIWTGGEIDIFYALISFLQISLLLSFALGKLKVVYAFTGAYIFMAIGVLTKALPSIAFMATTLIAVWWYTKSIKSILNFEHLFGITVFGFLMFLFFYWYDDKSKAGILISNALFEAKDKTALGGNIVSLLKGIATYPLLIAKALLPWSLIVLLLFKTKISFFKNRKIGLIALIFLLNIPLYWFTGNPKLRYIFPLLPFIAILFSHIVIEFYNQEKHLSLKKHIYKGIEILSYIMLAAALGLGIWFKQYVAAGFIVIIIAVVIAYLKKYNEFQFVSKPVIILTALMITARLVFAGIVIPYGSQHPKTDYRASLKTMDSLVNKAEIQWYGEALNRKLSVVPVLNNADSMYEIFPVSYQIPYYYFKQTNNILRFSDTLENGKFYISEMRFLPVNADTIQRFNRFSYGQDVMLFKY